MSGSKKKLLRKEEQLNADSENGHQELGKTKRTKLIVLITTAVTALVVVFLFLLSSGALHRATTALSVGSVKYSSAEYNLGYFSQVDNYVANLANYGYSATDIGLDVSKPLDEQIYPGSETGESWGDYFREKNNASLKQAAQLYLEAKAAGTVLSEDLQKGIDGSIESIKQYCETSQTTVDKYLTEKYGEGVDESVFRSFLEKIYLASYYGSEKNKSFSATDAEITEYYNANKDSFDLVDFRAFYFDAAPAAESDDSSASDQDNAVSEESMAQAKQKADEMCAKITDEESFIRLSQEYATEDEKESYEDAEATLNKKVSASQLSDELKAYLFDSARKAGDKAVIASSSYYTVVYMIKRYRSEDPTVNVRHILKMPEVSEGANEATDEQKAAAKAAAEEIYDEWKNGEATEDSFAQLAGEKTEDTGSSVNGGLYENVYPGQMETEFDEWCFDPSRKPGDTDIVETVYGYHVMYFSGRAEDYWKVQVKDTIVNNAFNDYIATLDEKYKLKEHKIGLKLTGYK